MTDDALEVPAGADGGNPEVPEKAKRRRFEAAYELRILEESGRATDPEALLRCQGLYSSHLTDWRAVRVVDRIGDEVESSKNFVSYLFPR